MKNLLCFVVLLSVTAINLIDAACLKFPNVTNAQFNENCGDVLLTCEKGYTMQLGMECVDGEWKYQEPFCKPPECYFEYTNNTYIDPYYFNATEVMNMTECDEICRNNTHCSFSKLDECYEYRNNIILHPISFVEIINIKNQKECDEECKNNTRCSTARADSRFCALFSTPLISISVFTDLNQCIEKCNQMNECLLLSYLGNKGDCFIYNVTLHNIPETFRRGPSDGDTIAEKYICN
ncbi:hypothetical protein LOTGIDRAFT_233843 [Lottia gigantea]|uniref:Apple domain-containing protein n=1 Tax=Lottia gigantea TaxID=225164 RepID=V4AAP8_LOTGI|nr:hypothetical protein LOTGIDRAFT_233843 [Lottia gigantea]ESO90356.1 hypothetical protein LOTGIDRAFT_233843 [Lottia gigantea]